MRKAGEVTFVDAHRTNKNEGWVVCPVGPGSGLYSLVIFRSKTFGLVARWPMFLMDWERERLPRACPIINPHFLFTINKKKCSTWKQTKYTLGWMVAIMKWACWLNVVWFYRVVEFASHSDMKNAIDKLDGTDLNGRKLKLSEDRKSRLVSLFQLLVSLRLDKHRNFTVIFQLVVNQCSHYIFIYF